MNNDQLWLKSISLHNVVFFEIVKSLQIIQSQLKIQDMKLFLNQDFVNKEQFWPESTIPDGRPDSKVDSYNVY